MLKGEKLETYKMKTWEVRGQVLKNQRTKKKWNEYKTVTDIEIKLIQIYQ